MEKHFESFLQDCLDWGHTQVKLVLRVNEHGKIAFYAVGQCGPTSGETFEAVVEGKHVRRVYDIPRAAIAVRDFTEDELDDIALSEASVADVGAALDAEDEAAAE
jgi:hypothetical protein